MNILNNINTPEDIKKLDINDLQRLSKEIRHFLINSISITGGHLASNLGVVELTLAMHSVFDSPKDKIIWDVGHQAYIHKIITRRKDDFHSLRQYKGLSGFPKRSESQHDPFETGHSSTSISAGLGMAMARDLKKENHSVISVIGDGAMTGGMAFEALNHAGHSKTDFIVILNDNEMSISENVGGLSKYLNKLRSAPTYSKMKLDVEHILRRIPAIGDTVAKTAQKTKDSIKYFFVPGVIFEELGFTYLGPVDGHNLEELMYFLKRAKNIKGPVLVHTITKKGKGYRFAEKYPDKFHGISPFNIETGKTEGKKSGKSYSDVFGDKLVELAESNPDIVAITAAMPSGTGLKKFADKYPDRFFDVGIAEQHAVTFAAGLASYGLKPVFAVYSTFLQRGFDQIIHDVCLQNLPVIFGIDRAGIVGQDGETHHGVFDLSYLMSIPNLKILVPKDGNELESMLAYAVNHNGPVAIRYPRGNTSTTKDELTPKSENDMEKAEILKDGKDLCIIGAGKMVKTALEVSEKLEKENISAMVINPRSIKPIDEATILKHIQNIDRIITIEDNVLISGFGSRIIEMLSRNNINNKSVQAFGLPDKFIEHGDTNKLFEVYELDSQSIFNRVMDKPKQ